MWRPTLVLLGLLVFLALLGYRFSYREAPPPPIAPVSSPAVERAPVCPWREPQRDLAILFSPATNYLLETRILSGLMVPIQRRLGRAMTVDENPLRVFRVQHQEHWLGSVLLCRVRGEHGGIEIVTGIATNGTIHRVQIQSQREPEPVARAITAANFLHSFVGKDSTSSFRVGDDLAKVTAEARASAQAIADGVRSQLIVLTFSEEPLALRERAAQPHH